MYPFTGLPGGQSAVQQPLGQPPPARRAVREDKSNLTASAEQQMQRPSINAVSRFVLQIEQYKRKVSD